MIQRLIMVLLLFSDDGRDCRHSGGIAVLENRKLVRQMAKYDAFHGHRRSHDRARAEQSSQDPQHESAHAAKHVAAAARMIAPRQFRAENGSVPALVRAELDEFVDHVRCRESRQENLPAVDVHGAVLARMIDLDDAVAEISVSGLHSRPRRTDPRAQPAGA